MKKSMNVRSFSSLVRFLILNCFFISSISAIEFDLGPEICHVKRTREGGTSQSGTLYGLRATLERLNRCKYYYGLEGAYTTGVLNGYSGADAKLKSNFTQFNFEGRLGYTFQSKGEKYLSITPYLCLGRYLEFNHYVKPSPMKIHFKNRFFYEGWGCILRGRLSPQLYFGLDVSARYSSDGKVKTSHDPEVESITINYVQKIHCRASLPFYYQICKTNDHFYLNFVPFFEYRHYGKKKSIPFDFLDTRIRCWGADLRCTYSF